MGILPSCRNHRRRRHRHYRYCLHRHMPRPYSRFPEAMELVLETVIEAVITLSVLVIANGNCISAIVVPLLEAMGVPSDVAQSSP